VETIVLCGAGPQYAKLADEFREQLAPGVELFDPFEGLLLEGSLRRDLPDHPARFAALLGMLWDELDETPHAFDFLNPRRRPRPPSRRNTYSLAGLTAATVVLGFILGGWLYGQKIETDVKKLNRVSNDLDDEIAKATEFETVVNELELWAYPEIVWLDELHRLSANFPPSKEAMLTVLRMVPSSEGGQITFSLLVDEPGTITKMKEFITARKVFPKKEEGNAGDGGPMQEDTEAPAKIKRDESREVNSGDTRKEDSHERYDWVHSASLMIQREKP
jgi:hypothetical protein